jgi:multisubunit Na+/H+ antiporter MnhG subunit
MRKTADVYNKVHNKTKTCELYHALRTVTVHFIALADELSVNFIVTSIEQKNVLGARTGEYRTSGLI